MKINDTKGVTTLDDVDFVIDSIHNVLPKWWRVPVTLHNNTLQMLTLLSSWSCHNLIAHFSKTLKNEDYKKERIGPRYKDKSKGLDFALYGLAYPDSVFISLEHHNGRPKEFLAFNILHEIGHSVFHKCGRYRDENLADKFAFHYMKKLGWKTEHLGETLQN